MENAWGLNPWTEEIDFVPVDVTAAPVWRVPKPIVRTWWPGETSASFEVEYEALYAKEYASPELAWRGFVYVAPHDEDRLLAALQAVERFLLLVALIR